MQLAGLRAAARSASLGATLAGALGLACVPSSDHTSSPVPSLSTASAASAPVRPSAAASATAPGSSPLSEARLMDHVRALTATAMAGREAGTKDELRAADYIAGQLESMKVGPVDHYRHPFPFRSGESLNVVGKIDGRGAQANEIVVLGAHMDHLGTVGEQVFHGAEDNASGVAVVLEVARSLAAERSALDRSVVVVFFGAEEAGLWGSRAFAASPPLTPMVAMVNVDMIGRDLVDQARFAALKPLFGVNARKAIGVLGAKGRPVFRDIVTRAARAEDLKAWGPEDLPGPLGAWAERESQGRGDNFSFEAVGVPALFFGQGESDDYHQPSDTPDKLVPSAMAARARVIHRVVVDLSQADLSSLAAPEASPPETATP